MTNNTLINFEMLHPYNIRVSLLIEKITVVAAICSNLTMPIKRYLEVEQLLRKNVLLYIYSHIVYQ